jgi:hypothetical protein
MQELEELERRGWEALCGPDGAAFYDEVMADDGLMVFPGTILDRDASLAAIASAAPWASFELIDVQAVELSADAGLVTYRAVAQRPGRPPYEALMTSVYSRREGAWRLVLHQQTPASSP